MSNPQSNLTPAATRARNSEKPGAASDEREDSRPQGIRRAPAESLAQPIEEGTFADKFKVLKYVPLECPNCGFEGKVKITLLDHTFHCKQCNQDFHVTVRGTVPGKRPPAEGIVDPSAPVELDKPNRIEVWFNRLPPGARWAMLPATVAAIVFLVVLFRWTRDAPLPRDLQKRAELAGRALALGDLHTLDRMTMSDELETLRTWYEAVRPNEFTKLTPESDVTVTVGQLSKLMRRVEKVAGKKKAVADFRTPLEIALPPEDEMQLVGQVDLVWVKEDGEWRIDGDWLRDSEQRIEFGPPRPFVPAVPAGAAAETFAADDVAAENVDEEEVDGEERASKAVTAPPQPARPKTAAERKRLREARIMEDADEQRAVAQKAAEKEAAEQEKEIPLSPAQRRRMREK